MTTATQPITPAEARETVINWIAALKADIVCQDMTPSLRSLHIINLSLYAAALKGAAPIDTVNRAMAYVDGLRGGHDGN
jgi:hypothetical protein